ncbi:hypothetical protein HYW54_02740 [Candidatus Gottesmanbacteria bacterium]|nr:hypothetical protein [Candidatus Gottesmanbacteria bacterium]
MENPSPKIDDALKDKVDLNKVLLVWTGPSHPFKKKDRIFYQTVAALTFLLVAIVFFIQDFLLIAVILAIAFVVYAISSYPPVDVEHKVTPAGFENAGRLFHWIELYGFWFEEKWGFKTLVIQTRLSFPAQIRAVLRDVSEAQVRDIIGRYLIHLETPPRSWVDSASDWLGRKIPLESTK